MSETQVIGSRINSIDLAALLLAYGFELADMATVETVSLDSTTRAQDKGSMHSWSFRPRSVCGLSVDDIRARWRMPRKASVDPVQVGRLLAHNHAALRHAAQQQRGLEVQDVGGLGRIDAPGRAVPMVTDYGGGVTDLDCAALAVTLGVQPCAVMTRLGRYAVDFARPQPGQVGLADVQAMLRDPALRREDNLSLCAVLVCMLDNRRVILDNIHQARRRVRLTASNGQVQALIEPAALSARQRAEVERHFS